MPSRRGVEADAFVDVVGVGRAVGAGDLQRNDLVLELAGLRRGDRALVAVVGVLVELVLGQAVLLRHHFGAGELAELDVRIALLDVRALVVCRSRSWPAATTAVPIGTRVMLRRRRRSRCPWCRDITACAAKCSACCDEPHWRSTEVPGTLSGSFEAMTALRAMLLDCSPACMTQPMMTSSICVGIGAGALDQRVQHGRGEIGRMPAGEASSLAAAGGAGGGDDIGLGHVLFSLIVLGWFEGWAGFKCRSGI